MVPRVVSAASATLAALCALVLGCTPESPPRGPEEICARACETRTQQCTPRQCRRGCNLVIDRLAEHEGDAVIACVAHEVPGGPGRVACDDRAWAHCATLVGPYSDGGPPAPPPPPDDAFQEEE
jgi:hypothetical protein